jgi:hypothetical protein
MEICGKTLEGRDIPCLICGNAKKYILLAGAVHAGESGPELILPVAEYMLEKNPDFLKKTGIIAVPSLNIDMRERLVKGVPWYLRLNAAGVDLNRNFPTGWDKVDFSYGLDSSERGAATYRGPSPFSEPETRALMSAAENFKITAAFSFHALASICGLPALMPRKAERDSVYNESCKKIISAFAEGFYPGEVYQERWLYHGTSGGSFPEWLYDIAGIPAFDFEAGADQTWLPARTDKTDRALLEIYQEKHRRGFESLLKSLM